MRTYKLTIAYDGTAYQGWQRQANILGGISCPVKYGFNGAIPELIINKLLSLCGTSEKLFIFK